MSIFLICLNYLSYLLEITYYLSNKLLLFEPSSTRNSCRTRGCLGYDGTALFIRALLRFQTIEEVGIGTYAEVSTVRMDDTLLHVLQLIAAKKLTAVPVVDQSGTWKRVT